MGGLRDDKVAAPSAGPARPPVPPPIRSAGGRPTAAARPAARPAPVVPAVAAAVPAVEAAVPAVAAVDDAAPRSRSLWPVVGLVLAAAATVAVFVTDNALVLRIALLAVCWAVVGVAFLSGDRQTAEDELRRPRDREETLQDSRLRRAAEESMREEIAQLRTELAAVGGLRAELAGVGQLRAELATLGRLRDEVAALTQLRADLEGVGELRADLGRLRAEVTEQLSGELFYERMVMRAQTVRGPLAGGGIDAPTIEGAATWETVAPAPQPVVELPRPVEVPRAPVPPPPVEPARPLSPREWLQVESVLEPRVEDRPRSPIESLGDRSLLQTAERPAVPAPASSPATGPRPVPFSRRDWVPDTSAGTAPRHHRRAAEPDEPPRVPEVVADAVPAPSGSHAAQDAPARRPVPEPQGHARLAQILADSGVEAPSGRRRRRYRDDDEPDDVLSRVLGHD